MSWSRGLYVTCGGAATPRLFIRASSSSPPQCRAQIGTEGGGDRFASNPSPNLSVERPHARREPFLRQLSPSRSQARLPSMLKRFTYTVFRRASLARAGRVSLLGVWLASFALLLQTVLPLLNRPASAEGAAFAFGGEAAICSAHGLGKLIGTDSGTTTRGDAGAAARPVKCPLCQVWQSLGGALPASAPSILGPVHQPADDDAVADSTRQARHHLESLRARAPPPAA